MAASQLAWWLVCRWKSLWDGRVFPSSPLASRERDYSVGDLVTLPEAELKARVFLPGGALRATQVAETTDVYQYVGQIVNSDRLCNVDTELEAVR